jgi:hypothetical protein
MSLRQYRVLLCDRCATGDISNCRSPGCLCWMADLPKERAIVGHAQIAMVAVQRLSTKQLDALDAARAFERGDLS